jgi:hypothetical protein
MYGKKHAWAMVEALSATVQVCILQLHSVPDTILFILLFICHKYNQELAEESENKAGQTRGTIDDITWSLPHLESAMLQAIGKSSPGKNPATNATWPAIKSLADVLTCRFVVV